jgi:threonine/homoserine/homoserine lactone efflux protein
MGPLTVSPGPANIALASLAASRGLRAAMIFAGGLTLVNGMTVALMGLGMGVLYAEYREFFIILEHVGALYIVYLGWRILTSPVNKEVKGQAKELGFSDAVTLQLLNTKHYSVLVMMYSQFIDGDRATGAEVAELGLLLVSTRLVSCFLCACFGLVIGQVKGSALEWIQRYGFGGLLMLVGTGLFAHSFDLI